MPVITISRQLGSFGKPIAEEVAARLSAVCVDKEVLAAMAQQEGVSVELIEQAEKRLVSLPVAVSEEMKSLLSSQTNKPGALANPKSFVSQLSAAIRVLADQGNVVFVGRGTQLLLADYPQVLHVRIYAPEDVRARRIQERRDLDQEMALRVVRQADEQRNDWFRRFFPSISWKDSRHYHLMVNTARIPEDAAAEIIVQAARSTH